MLKAGVRDWEGCLSVTPKSRLPEDFDETTYLALHRDVSLAVTAGAFASGVQHYILYGAAEGRPYLPTANFQPARAITELSDLDAEIYRLRDLERRSFSEWLRARASFWFQEDVASLPSDPLSVAYATAQLDLYRRIAGVPAYDAWTAEPTRIDVPRSVDPHPFPFSTRDGELIGGHLLALGHIMQALWRAKPGPGHAVLEYGCGTGFTTLMLAASGYQMTAVDINDDALKVIDVMANTRGLRIRTYRGEFGSIPEPELKYPIVLFYEAFHHCLTFTDLLKRLHALIASDGVVLFAGEPIFQDFPKPWGLRLDGASLWEIRTKGWLELGFREDFFVDLLARTGWSYEKHDGAGAPPIFIARRA